MSDSTQTSISIMQRPALLTAVLLLVGASIVAGFYWQRSLTLNEVKVSGIWYQETAEVVAAAQVPMGISPDSLELTSMIHRVEKLPYVKKLHPIVEPGGVLRLEIEERAPIGLFINGSLERYVDPDGVILPILPNKTTNLPLVYGFRIGNSNDTLQTEQFRQVRDFLVEAQKYEFAWATISEVAYDREEGVIALSHENGVKILFGTQDFNQKLANWELFYAEIIREKGIAQVAQVDLRFNDQIITRES
jgi:cell division septal protein FtsQ